MDTFQHNGTTYVKVSILAKRHRYTADYIGQLCRGNKVDAQLVGRAWYVNEISLLSHKIDRKKDTRPNEIICKNSTEFDSPEPDAIKISIRPTLSKKTHRQFFSDELRPTVEHNWQNRTVSYVDDSATLVPQITNKIFKTLVESVPAEKVFAIPIDLVQSEKVIVKDVSHHNHREHLTFTELPEVLLEGSLQISDLDSAADYTESEPVTPEDLPSIVHSEVPQVTKISRYQKPVRSSHTLSNRSAPVVKKSALPVSVSQVIITRPPTEAPKPLKANFEMRAVREKRVRSIPLFVIPVLIILSVLVTGFSLAFSSVTVYEEGTTRSSFSFHKSFIGEALLYLAK